MLRASTPHTFSFCSPVKEPAPSTSTVFFQLPHQRPFPLMLRASTHRTFSFCSPDKEPAPSTCAVRSAAFCRVSGHICHSRAVIPFLISFAKPFSFPLVFSHTFPGSQHLFVPLSFKSVSCSHRTLPEALRCPASSQPFHNEV